MKRLALVILLPILLLYGCYKLTFPTYSWHQKLTLVVETPDGARSGASVVKIWIKNGPSLGQIPGYSSGLRGEATVVDLGDGRYLFALLKGRIGLERAAFKGQIPADQMLHFAVNQLEGAANVPLQDAPLLVTFDDLSDPASVRRVDPADLAATFGAGYALKGITLEITDAPVTEGVLGWLGDGHTLKEMWNSLSWQQHDILTSTNWRKGN